MNTCMVEQERYCIFISGSSCFGVPALQIDQVVPTPELTPVPVSTNALSGLARIRNEFLPAFRLRSVLELGADDRGFEPQMLVVRSVNGKWGLLIDRTVSVSPLETSFSSLERQDDTWSQVTSGSASFREHVIQILDPNALFQFLVAKLEQSWNQTYVHSCSPALIEETK